MINKTVFIGIGTNLGNRGKNIKTALGALGKFVIPQKISSIYETEPVDYEQQGWFLNMVVQAVTELSPFELLYKLQETEVSMGRQPCFDKGPRIIDLDILLYSDLVMKTDILIIPHPEMHKRNFVLTPLKEIAPDFIHPELKKDIQSLFINQKEKKEVRIWSNDFVDRQL